MSDTDDADDELEQFIAATLVQIACGVRVATTALLADEASRNGGGAEQRPVAFVLPYGSKADKGEGIHFDVAVTADQSKSGEAGAGFNIKIARMGVDGEARASESRVSRVQFSVQVDSNARPLTELADSQEEPLSDY